jgi:hypothetical protein
MLKDTFACDLVCFPTVGEPPRLYSESVPFSPMIEFTFQLTERMLQPRESLFSLADETSFDAY